MTMEVFPVANFTPPNSFSVIKVFNFLPFDFPRNQNEIFPDRLLV
jgi:hypothetical protein